MTSLLYPVIAGASVGILLLVILALSLPPPAPEIDYEKVRIFSNNASIGYLTDEIVKQSVDSSLSDPSARRFVEDSRNFDLNIYVRYMTPDEVHASKFDPKGQPNPGLEFLPDNSAVVKVHFDSADVGIPERPMIDVYLDPETYKVLGSTK